MVINQYFKLNKNIVLFNNFRTQKWKIYITYKSE